MRVSKVLSFFTAPVEVNGVEEDEEDEEEDEEVILEEKNMEVEPQKELKRSEGKVGVDEAGMCPGPSCPARTPQPPDEEQAGSVLFSQLAQVKRAVICTLYFINYKFLFSLHPQDPVV